MASINTKSSVFSVMEESSEGVITEPAAATDFIALQDDLDIDPAIEYLENPEAKASLGKAKGITGAENPSISLSHLLRGSGVSGQAPNFGKLLKSIFGSEVIRSSADAVSGVATVSTIPVADESIYSVGEALLVKDPNGYTVRPVHSIAANELTLGFDMQNIPADTTPIGKSVTYAPVNTGHPTLTAWHYAGNGGAKQTVRGARVTSFSFSAEAGQLINATYSLEGLEFYYNAIKIAATNKYLDFTSDNGTFAISVAEKWYKTPHELAAAIESAMGVIDPLETYSCVYSDTLGKFIISSSTSAVLSLLWSTGANTANTIGTTLGFAVAADDTGATSYTSDNEQSYVAAFSPTFDSSEALVAKGHQIMFGDKEDYVCFGPSSVSFDMSMEKKTIDNICSASGRGASLFVGRSCTVSITGLLEKHDVDTFRRLLENKDSRFCYIGGPKIGGNWVEGKTWCLYLPYCNVTTSKVSDDESVAVNEFEVASFVPDDGSKEVFLSFV